jgi:serine/threonine-protein kinase HipA
MAVELGLNMAIGKAQTYSSRQHTYLTRRFDRINNKRIHFASTMTLLGYKDGKGNYDGVSYLKIVDLWQKESKVMILI